MESKISGGEKRAKYRPSFADAIIAAAVVILLFVLVARLMAPHSENRQVVVLKISQSDMEVYSQTSCVLDRGTEILALEDGEQLGTVYAAYAVGEETLMILVDGGEKGRVWNCNDKVSIRAGNMLLRDATVIDIRKVDEV